MIICARVLQALSSEPLAQTRASWLRAPIMATGFDAMAPDLRAVFEHPAVSATFQDEPGTPGSPRVFAAADPTDEAERAADWACQCLARGQGRIGIVTLDPGADTRLLERALERRVHPGRAPDADGANRLFDVSRGEALADEPVVAQALRTLDLAIRGLGAEELGRWLLSPFGKGAVDELDARALLDLKLRGAGIGGWDALAKQSPDLRGQGGISALAAGLGRMRKELRDAPRSAVLSAWAGRFGRVLRAAGWPGGRTPNSREFQAIAHWSDLLDTLVSLEHQLGPVSADAALEYLNALAREQVFQQRVDAAPIQVLGVLEAAGMSFDALWILGVTEDVWPPMPNPDPLLPREEQRRRAMPHASAERELEFARGITARLLAGAPEVVVSYPRSANDAPVRPSALIAAFARLDADEIVPAGLWMDVFSPEELEATDDPRGPELDADANTGGVALLQDQSACAFRAFAHHRLKLRPIEEVAEGPDARERGTLVHLALQRFWEGLEGRSPRLLALDEEGLKTRAGEAAMQALEERRGKASQFYSGPISGLEGARLTELVERWAQTEQQRSVGFRVESMEAEQQLDFGPLSLRGRVDRVDLLDNGERLIIDYKTGRIPGTGKAWRDPPPAEPQLPAYGLCLDAGGIAYAQVRAEQCRWTGLASADVGIKGVKSVSADETGPGWDGLMEEWRGALDGLASEFASGWAAVMPRDEAVCSYCALGGVCRVE
ncbi:MAG: PD-(D/E)XK nuclease family protein [Gammaproteobacteria bacterium]